MNKARRWRKIITMMLTVVMLLQNTQSVMVFADVTNEQIEQRLAGEQPQVEQEQTQAEQTQPEQSQVETRASGEGYKAQAQESQEGWSDGSDTGNPDAAESTTMEGTASNANVTAAITQSVFQAEVSGTVCNFVQMTAQITNHDAENPATGVSIKALLHSSQLSYVNGYGTETAGAGAYVTDSNNTSDLPGGSANGYDQIIMWTDQTIAAGGMAVYQFAAQIIPATLDGVVNAWYVNGNSCGYTWQNTEILTTGADTGSNAGSNTGDNAGSSTRGKPRSSTRDNAGSNTGDNAGSNTGDNAGSNAGDSSGDNTGDNTGNNRDTGREQESGGNRRFRGKSNTGADAGGGG